MLNQLNMDLHQNKSKKIIKQRNRKGVYRDIWFSWLMKVKENKNRLQRHDLNIDSSKKRLRSPLEIGEKVFVLSECLKKKDAPWKFYKGSTENKKFFNRDRIFTIVNRSEINDQGSIYWIKESDKKINGRFLRQELYALNNQFVE